MNLVPTSTRIIATVAVIISGAAILTATGPAHAQAPASGPGPELQTIELRTEAGATRTEAAPAVAPRVTRPFSLVGATWTDPRVALAGSVEVRTRATAGGTWTAWQTLESDEPNAADPGTEPGPVRGSTDPLWVGESDGVEARVVTSDGRAGPLPAGLRLDLINPDDRAGAETRDQAFPEPEARAGVVLPPRPVPRMVTRSGWGANEAIVKNAPEYTTNVQVMFVHHTATSNNYTCAQSASIVRGVELYHVRSRGWNDIGYNFLVDKCGTLFEGRRGGVNRPVLGAHTLGFNSYSSAIAVIGNYTATSAPVRVLGVIAQVAAYKVGAYGNNPNGRVVLTSSGSDRYPAGARVTLNRISGHRDTGRTECPGNALYAQLGRIRASAGAGPAGLHYLRMTGSLKAGTRFFTRGLIRPLWNLTTPSVLLSRFDVLVDGRLVASLPNTNRTTTLRLSAGTHLVGIRAVHLSGRYSMTTARVVADATPPAFSAGPVAMLRTGSIRSAVPMQLGWTATDSTALRGVRLTRPAVLNLGTTRSRAVYAAPNVATTWTLQAVDWAGNAASASVSRTPSVVTEQAGARGGAWRVLRNPVYISGLALNSTVAGASVTYTFTGRGVALIASKTPNSGRLRVYLDGSYRGLLDLRSATTVNRLTVAAANFGGSGSHTVKFVLEGTAGRPGVIMDGVVVLR